MGAVEAVPGISRCLAIGLVQILGDHPVAVEKSPVQRDDIFHDDDEFIPIPVKTGENRILELIVEGVDVPLIDCFSFPGAGTDAILD